MNAGLHSAMKSPCTINPWWLLQRTPEFRPHWKYAIFQDHGYKGLYGGLGCRDIHARKDLKKSQKILDHMGSTELAANLFRATQTEEKLRRDGVDNKHDANKTHNAVGKKVRQTIKELGGTMPEDLWLLPLCA